MNHSDLCEDTDSANEISIIVNNDCYFFRMGLCATHVVLVPVDSMLVTPSINSCQDSDFKIQFVKKDETIILFGFL